MQSKIRTKMLKLFFSLCVISLTIDEQYCRVSLLKIHIKFIIHSANSGHFAWHCSLLTLTNILQFLPTNVPACKHETCQPNNLFFLPPPTKQHSFFMFNPLYGVNKLYNILDSTIFFVIGTFHPLRNPVS